MQTKCRLDRSDLRRRGRDDVIARQRQLETATQANAVNTGDQRNWQKLHEAQKFDAVQSPIFTALICAEASALNNLEVAIPTAVLVFVLTALAMTVISRSSS